MKLDECEETILSALAEMDGETPLLSAEQKARHLRGCEPCSMEIERQQAAVYLLQRQKRREPDAADLWVGIEKRIVEKQVSEPVLRRYFFLFLGAILVIYKLLEMIPARDLGFTFKFVPVVIVAALFYFFRENPFKINTGLKL